jgi:long-chain acyl-CoA synthetase
MDWTRHPLPAMRAEARFGDRVIPAFVDRPKNVWAMVEQAAARNPDGEALICGDRRMTWRETRRASARIAGGFEALGVEPGDRIAVMVGNRVEFVLAMFAAAQLGAVLVPMSTRLQTPEVAYVLNDCGAKLLIHEEAFADRIPANADTPCVDEYVTLSGRGVALPFETIQSASSRRVPTPVDEQDTAMLLYTSGTTGKPKGAMLAHCNIIHSAMVYEITMGLTQADRSIAVVPLAHVTGIVANIAAMARCAGALIIAQEFRAADYLALVARERA